MNTQQNDHQRAEPLRQGSSDESVKKQDAGVAAAEGVSESQEFASDASSDAEGDATNYDHLPPSQRPRKKVYLSTLRKRNREKKRRDHFNEGLERLAELVFQVNPSISSGRDAHIARDAKLTTITNRGELMQSAVDAMSALIREHSQQQSTILNLTEALREANTKCRLLQEQVNAFANSRATLSGGLPVDGCRVRGLHDPIGVINSAAASPFQRFAADVTGNVRQGFGFNSQHMNSGPSSRPPTLEALLSSSGNTSTSNDFGGPSDLLLRTSFLLQQQRASAYQHASADIVTSAQGHPSVDSVARQDPHAFALYQQLLQPSGGVDRHRDSIVGATTQTLPLLGESVSSPKSRRRKRADDTRREK